MKICTKHGGAFDGDECPRCKTERDALQAERARAPIPPAPPPVRLSRDDRVLIVAAILWGTEHRTREDALIDAEEFVAEADARRPAVPR